MLCDETFAPSAARGRAVDIRMHHELAASLEYLSEETAPSMPDIAARIARHASLLRDGRRTPPLGFKAYYDLVLRLADGDAAGAGCALDSMRAQGERTSRRRIVHFGQPEADETCAALRREGMEIAPIDDGVAARFGSLLDEALDLMARALPDLHGEIAALVHEVLLAQAPPGQTMEFDGGSHYQFWGLLMLNPKHHRTPLAVFEVLAHEAAHLLLFGLTIDEPLVWNPDTELYASPLRVDPRPMDGIYHATFVSARMAWAMEGLANSGLLSDAEQATALEAAQKDRENFARGLSVVDAHGRLSNTGTRILDGARTWIAA